VCVCEVGASLFLSYALYLDITTSTYPHTHTHTHHTTQQQIHTGGKFDCANDKCSEVFLTAQCMYCSSLGYRNKPKGFKCDWCGKKNGKHCTALYHMILVCVCVLVSRTGARICVCMCMSA
jgi:hypothetical protein